MTHRRIQVAPEPRQSRAAIYCRVSTAKQEDEGTSLETQEAACRALAADRGYAVAMVYREVFTGAELYARPLLTAARQAIRTGVADVLLCYAVDRLARKQAHVAIVAEEVEQAGARLEFVTEDFERSAVGEFIRSAKAFAAEVEREKIAERTQRGLRARVASGKPVGTAPPPFGLRWRDAAKSGYEIDPATIGIVRRIFAEYDRGASLRKIAASLDADGILPPRHARTGATRWGLTAIRHILTERAYTGAGQAFRYKVEKGAGGHPVVALRPDVERVALPAGTYPVVIESPLFERVGLRLSTNRRESMRPDRNPEVGILRRGFAKCGVCGHRLVVTYERGAPVYRCHVQNRRRHGCPGASMRVDVLDAAVWARVEAILTDPSTVAAEVERLRRDDPTAADLEMIDRQLAGLARRQASVAQAVAMLDGNLEALAPLVAQLDAIGKQRQAVERERVAIEDRQTGWRVAQARLAGAADYCRRVAASLRLLTFAERRLALEALGVSVRVFRADCDPRWIVTLALPFDDGATTRPTGGNVFSSGGTTATSSATTASPMATTSSS